VTARRLSPRWPAGTVAAHRLLAGTLRRLREENTAAMSRLANALSDLMFERSVHRSLCGIPASGGGERGVAEALHRLTGLPVVIEDRFGNVRAWAGPGRPNPYPISSPSQREEFLRDAARCGSATRIKDRLAAVVRARGGSMVEVLALVDPKRTAGRHEMQAVEHAALVLAAELAHQQELAELERRLRGDLVAELLTGTERDNVVARCRALDHDLRGPHHVVVIRWDSGINGTLSRAAEHAAAGLGVPALVSTVDGTTVLLAQGRPDGRGLHDAITRRLRTPAGSIGVGGRCGSPEEFPRSFQEALLALDVRLASRSPHGATSFDELGFLRMLDTGAGGAKIRRFVRDWLGPLLDYDTRNRSQLVWTLAQYLDCGGNYDDTAKALVIHRSTLRYRLQRIREVGGLDLADPDSRLNLHVAARAWRILDEAT
jgi:sugar diacid utilization regulator